MRLWWNGIHNGLKIRRGNLEGSNPSNRTNYILEHMFGGVKFCLNGENNMTTKRIGIAVAAFMLCIAMCLSLAACGQKMTLEAFVASEAMQNEMKTLKESMDDSMDIRLEARENSLTYVFQYKEDTGMDNATLAEALASSLDGMEATFTSILNSLKMAVPDAESVIVEYQDMNGEVITSKEFK